jgi:hypothetical protein
MPTRKLGLESNRGESNGFTSAGIDREGTTRDSSGRKGEGCCKRTDMTGQPRFPVLCHRIVT